MTQPIKKLTTNKHELLGGVPQWTDSALIAEIKRIRDAIRKWAKSHDLWFDCGFTSHLDHVDCEPPDPPIVTLLTCDGGLYSVLSGEDPEGLEREFSALLDTLGYHYENIDGVTIAIYAADPLASTAFKDFFHWQWVCSLVKLDTADVYHELYSHFARRPDDLHRLHWRDFEILLFRIFQNQGFEAVLGPGRGDNGIDLRLWQRNPIGDILTLVQAKCYAKKNKINLTEVAALYGIGQIEHADNTLFVTTSSYAPVARRFAARTSGSLQLAERNDIAQWCSRATAGIIADKSSLVSPASVQRIIDDVAGRKDSRIVHASYGRNMIFNNFALVIKETQHAALLMKIANRIVSHDGYEQSGFVVPIIDGTTASRFNGDTVFRAKRSTKNGQVSYWDGENLYQVWDGKQQYFSFLD
ncbi:restriction endonuclease [Herminiimonas arsenitoxidans]|uniref:restriction endonuclease n=1 Tax=Herminiimonas arsenitoxidans TaxID=1809410 RepID=UPI0018D38F11|nr:restriction endonuclease [Herminiimonas arsenitoxidans]